MQPNKKRLKKILCILYGFLVGHEGVVVIAACTIGSKLRMPESLIYEIVLLTGFSFGMNICSVKHWLLTDGAVHCTPVNSWLK